MNYYTKNGIEKLKEEIELIDKMKYKASKGEDVSSIYLEPGKKKQLQEELSTAIIIEETDEFLNWDYNTVIRMCKVGFTMNGIKQEFTILGKNECDTFNKILSCEAPLVLALLGHSVGDTVTFRDKTIYIDSVKAIDEDLDAIAYKKTKELL